MGGCGPVGTLPSQLKVATRLGVEVSDDELLLLLVLVQ